MRKIVIICLMAVHLFGNTELNQLFKVPELVSHFFQHHRQDPGISFIEFIAMHYGGDDGTKADDYEDGKMPFHNSHNHSLTSSYTIYLNASFETEVNETGTARVFGGRLQTGIPSKHVLLVLQPPRIS